MTTLTKKAIFNKYLSGCEFMGMEPEFKYSERTAKEIVDATDALRSRARSAKRSEVIDSATKNAAQLANFVEQKAGETKRAVMDRAKALNRLNPICISIKWRN